MSKIPKSVINTSEQNKEILKALKAALALQYPNCSVQAINGQIAFEPLDPPALRVNLKANFQIAEKTPK